MVSSFRQKISSITLIHLAPRKNSKLETRQVVAPEAIGSNIRGVIPLPRASTQAVPLASSARGVNRAHDLYTCFQGLWSARLTEDGATFALPSTLRMTIASGQSVRYHRLTRSEILTSTGLILVCGDLDGANVGLEDAQVDRLHTTHNIYYESSVHSMT